MKSDWIRSKARSSAGAAGEWAFIGPIKGLTVEISGEFHGAEEGTPQMRVLSDLFISDAEEPFVGLDEADLMVFAGHLDENQYCRLYCLSGDVDLIAQWIGTYPPHAKNAHYLLRCFISRSADLNDVERISNAIKRQWTGPDSMVVFGADVDDTFSVNEARIVILESAEWEKQQKG